MSAQIVLVCGAAEDGEIWQDVAPRIPEATTLTLPPTADLDGLAASVRGVIAPPAVLVGHSLGAAVCVLAAAAEPAAVRGLVLVACGSSLPVHPSVWETLRDGGEAAVAARLARAATSGHAAPPPERSVGARMEAMMRRAVPGTLTSHLRACASFAAPSLSISATVLAGERDRVVAPALSHALAGRLEARFATLPGVGHQIPWERDDAVAAAIGELIDA